jgi:acyl-CoA thioester hydrolase
MNLRPPTHKPGSAQRAGRGLPALPAKTDALHLRSTSGVEILNHHAMPAAVFQHTHRVVYAECTLGNHVYFARYLDMLEAARCEFFRQLGCSFLQLQQAGISFPVVGLNISYKRPARYDDMLTIELWVIQVSGARLNFGFRILHASGIALAEGEMRQVCVDQREKPKRLPPDLAQRLRPFLDGNAAAQ